MVITSVNYKAISLAFTILVILLVSYKQFHPIEVNKKCELRALSSILDIGDQDDCHLLNRLYHVKIVGDPIKIPLSMQAKVNDWLQNKTELLAEAGQQKVVEITNKWTGETTHYNPLRAKKPGAGVTQNMEYLQKIISESQASCDFCQARNYTVGYESKM